MKNRGIPRRLTQTISKANYSFVFSKYCDKDFNFTLCQEFYGAKKLASTEYSLYESRRNQAAKAAIITITFGVKILIKTN